MYKFCHVHAQAYSQMCSSHLTSLLDPPATLADLLAVKLIPNLLKQAFQQAGLFGSLYQLLRGMNTQGERSQILHTRVIPESHWYGSMTLHDELFIKTPVVWRHFNVVFGKGGCGVRVVG